jgi:sugar/nucleoside kinase (ribokinase family)
VQPSNRLTTTPIRIIANIGWVRASYPDGRSYTFPGGAGLHLSTAVSAAGGLATPISVVGIDLREVVTALEKRHIDTQAVKEVPDQPSCRFELSYDDNGSLISAISQFNAAQGLSEHALNQLDTPGHFHVSCRLPLDLAPLLAALAGRSYSLDFYSPSIANYLTLARPFLSGAHGIFINQAELALLQQIVGISELELLVVSDGARPVRLFSHGEMIAVVQPPIVAALEVTGAGDTLAGSYLASTLNGVAIHDALHIAVYAASAATKHWDPLSEQPSGG